MISTNIKNYIEDFLKKKKVKIINKKDIFENLDSLETMNLITLLEKKFKIQLNLANILDTKGISLKNLEKEIKKKLIKFY